MSNGKERLDKAGTTPGGDEAELATLCLVRHAKAASRQRWTGDDRDRPLTDRGHEQARLLADHVLRTLGRPSQILSSPAVRCRETVAPLAGEAGLDIVEVPWLDEGWTPDDAFERLRALTLQLDRTPGQGGNLAAVTHGDVMWGILELLVTGGVDLGEKPDAPKGGLWILGFRGRTPPSASFFLPQLAS
jgi:broad specificity phosphatase PhoE